MKIKGNLYNRNEAISLEEGLDIKLKEREKKMMINWIRIRP